MRRVSAHLSERGPVRSLNADAVLADDARGFYAVADGVGSSPLSARGSAFAVRAAYQVFEDKLRRTAAADIDLMLVVDEVFELFHREFARERRSPSTTLTVVVIDERVVRYVSIGDSPLFLIQGDRAALLTRHHTAVDQGRVIADFSEMKSQEGSNILINTLGAVRPRPETYTDIAPGNDCRLILCSDGLMELFHQDELAGLGGGPGTPKAALSAIRRRARARTAPDNFTALVVDLSLGGGASV